MGEDPKQTPPPGRRLKAFAPDAPPPAGPPQTAPGAAPAPGTVVSSAPASDDRLASGALAGSPPAPAPADRTPGSRVVKLADLGPVCPVGVPAGDRLLKAFALRPYDFDREVEIGGLREREPDMGVERWLPRALDVLLTDWPVANGTWARLRPEERVLYLEAAPLGDLLYAYLYLRVQEVGRYLNFEDFRAIPCGHLQRGVAGDLLDLDVRVYDKPADLVRRVDLGEGFPCRGRTVRWARVRPVRWSAMMSGATPGGKLNVGLVKRASILDAVVQFEGFEEGTPFVDGDLAQMRKGTIEVLTEQVDLGTGGPELFVTGKCATCSRDYRRRIPWEDVRFFSTRSL